MLDVKIVTVSDFVFDLGGKCLRVLLAGEPD
jgi:hypothetical protein